MIKRAFDFVVAAIALIVVAPLLALIALLVACTSGGGALYRATRVGRAGRPFGLLKFRTMRSVPGPRVSLGHDPRVTRVGSYLRRTHLDELPQLWNVLVGDMSLVGPRPEDPAFVDMQDARWREVLSVRPGLTGPTQLTWSRRESEMLAGADSERAYRIDVLPHKLASDAAYVERRSLVGDVGLLVRTAALPLGRRP